MKKLRKYLTKFGKDKMIAGDYGFYDKRMYAYLITCAFRVILRVGAQCGMTDRQLQHIACIAEDTAYAWYDFQGDIVQFFGSNPSGHPLTVIINCIVNSLYMRYCYHELNPQKEVVTFKKNVALITYGDDNAQGVSDHAPWFNHTAIQRVLAEIDVVYTMADKEAESIPYIHIDEVSFLKRMWVKDPESGIWLAPLEWDSINKMLTMCVASDSVDLKEQAASMVRNCALEMFHHGKESFRVNIAKLKRIIHKSGLDDWVDKGAIVTWDDYILYHKQSSESKTLIQDVNLENEVMLH